MIQASHDMDKDDGRRAAEQELASFTYIVAHDLAASFRHISEFSRLFMETLGDDLTASQRFHAEHMANASAGCKSMIEQLLAFSRVQQKRLEPVNQDAAAVAGQAWLQLDDKAKAAGARITIEPLGEVLADKDLLTLALHHLLDNAIKFRRPDTAPVISVQAGSDPEMWRIRVVDNGIGVEPAYREKAFEMFHRLNGEGAFPGVGAGLAICRRIARRHGGEVQFLDASHGACLELVLPRGPLQ